MALGHTELFLGQGRRDYATWSTVNKATTFILSNGNLTWTPNGSGFGSGIATMGKSSGKWLWEVFINGVGADSSVIRFGIANFTPTSGNTLVLGQSVGASSSIGWRGSPWAYSLNNNGTTSNVGASGTAYAANQYYLVAMDMDNKTLTIYRDNTLVMNAIAIPAAGSATWFPACCSTGNASSVCTANFGQSGWSSVNETARNTLVAAGYNLGIY